MNDLIEKNEFLQVVTLFGNMQVMISYLCYILNNICIGLIWNDKGMGRPFRLLTR